MGSMSLMHWLVVLAIVLVLFGAGKLPRVMGDFAKGIKAFKKNMADDTDASMEASAEKPTGSIAAPNAPTSSANTQSTAAHHG